MPTTHSLKLNSFVIYFLSLTVRYIDNLILDISYPTNPSINVTKITIIFK